MGARSQRHFVDFLSGMRELRRGGGGGGAMGEKAKGGVRGPAEGVAVRLSAPSKSSDVNVV